MDLRYILPFAALVAVALIITLAVRLTRSRSDRAAERRRLGAFIDLRTRD